MSTRLLHTNRHVLISKFHSTIIYKYVMLTSSKMKTRTGQFTHKTTGQLDLVLSLHAGALVALKLKKTYELHSDKNATNK